MRRIRNISGWQSILFLIIVLAVSVVVELVVSITWAIAGISIENTIALNIIIVNTLSLGLCVYGGIKWSGRKASSLLPHRIPSIALILSSILLAAAASILISDLDNCIRQFINIPSWLGDIEEYLFGDKKNVWMTAIGLVVVAPFTEEYLFRGFLLGGFLKRYSAHKAVFLSALLFSLFHLNPAQLIGAFFAGLLLGWVFVRTRSLVPCLIIHAVNNGMIILFDDILKIKIPGYNAIGALQPLWFDGIALVLFIVGWILISRWVPHVQPQEEEEELPYQPEEEAVQEELPGRRRHPVMGIVAFCMGIFAFFAVAAAIAWYIWLMIWMAKMSGQQLPDKQALIAIGSIIILAWLCFLLGILFSIIPLLYKRNKKLFPILGLVVNGIPFILLVVLFTIGLVNMMAI